MLSAPISLRPFRSCWLPTAVLVLLAALTGPAPAAEYDAYDGSWHFSLAPYLWIPGYDASFKFRVPPGASGSPEAHAGPIDVLSKLQFVFMGMADARKGRWSVFTDFLYLDLSDDRGRVTTITGPNGAVEIPVNTATKTGFTGTMWTLAPAYSIYHRGPTSSDLFLGLRYLNLDASLDWSFSSSNFLPRSGSLSQSTGLWDVVAGAKGRLGFGRSHWFLNYYADVGGGTSDLTWQALGGFGYAMSWGDIVLDFRYLKYSPGGNTKLLRDLELYGPTLGFRFHF